MAARDALLQLSTVGARIVGTVLNDASDDAVPYAQSYVQYYATHATSANR